MAKKLYVGNLPWSVAEKDLKKLFESYGEVTEAVVITEKFSGRSKGFGFVTFADDEAADKAISEMNGKDVSGREIKVTEAKPKEPGERSERRPRFNNRSDGGSSGGFNRRPRRFDRER